ncbi:hypothetical protein TVAG_391290 [Trichomonas vaginalis G3]|uniref:Uncharacterized protein n=1 Tax=Trichomonas vaginalis (strain ATCC PRA-98 / G3) TaxID=412133 RepID=A2DFP2_TRIV3|nr:hypothetical protein TVAGG3_0323670 [Trichomonas vaginalis G3]EAY20745.1 hypothetical protein TVAG_391290 [Trichomonas vaginalis G3]KAI5529480.1 hypothetical protein TVAGG3_0323670 [Trichomonas vaginalis G3]|eukprot:XP_001581731.1 hypothetical protein [Trichomonas vaginalis G3]
MSTKLGYLCERYNYRYCRLAHIIENSGCLYETIGQGPSILSVIALILGLIVCFFFVLFNSSFKEWPTKWENQRPTRGAIMWKAHFFILGIYAFFWGLSESVAPNDGSGLRALLALRMVSLVAGETMLFCIALLDTQLIPATTTTTIATIVISSLIGLLSLINLSKNIAESLIAVFGLGLPVGFIYAHFLMMVCVCCFRKLWKGLFWVFLMALTNSAPLFIEMTLNEPLCRVSVGWFPASCFGILIFGFYRLAATVFYPILKKHEAKDGLGNNRIQKGQAYDDENIPALIDGDDYEYSYTYTDVDDDQRLDM